NRDASAFIFGRCRATNSEQPVTAGSALDITAGYLWSASGVARRMAYRAAWHGGTAATAGAAGQQGRHLICLIDGNRNRHCLRARRHTDSRSICKGRNKPMLTTRRSVMRTSLLSTPMLLLSRESGFAQLSEMPPSAISETRQSAIDAYVYGYSLMTTEV